MSNNVLIIALAAIGAVLIAAFVAIVLLYDGDKGLALAGLVTVAGLCVPQLLSLKATVDAAVKLDVVDQKIDTNTVTTEQTHDLVNSQRTAMETEITRLQTLVTALTQERSVKANDDRHAETSETRIIAAVEAGPKT